MKAAERGWILDGNYTDKLADFEVGAQTIIWLDLPRGLVMRRLIARSVKRVVLRERLWNGNRERVRNLLNFDPEENIVLWGWVKHPEYRARYSELLETEWRDLEVHRVRTAG